MAKRILSMSVPQADEDAEFITFYMKLQDTVTNAVTVISVPIEAIHYGQSSEWKIAYCTVDDTIEGC